MNNIRTLFSFCFFLSISAFNYAYNNQTAVSTDSTEFRSERVLEQAFKVDNYIRFIKHPDYWNNTVVGGKSRPSNIWTRAVFYEGHMALYDISKDTAVFNYAYNWGKHHKWTMGYGNNNTVDGDNQCCGQTYMDLYNLKPSAEMLTNIKACLDYTMERNSYRHWTWIDAIQMSMPAFAMLGKITGNNKYWEYMYHSYKYTRDSLDVTGLYNEQDGLWWRDKDFNPPFVNGNKKQVYWSRGNGWVYAALVRVLSIIPKTEPHYQFYLNDFIKMSQALLACQRSDGFWDSSLADPNDYGGKETSGTALFVYGFAWGMNNNILSRNEYLTATRKGWAAMSRDAVHENGFLGWMQGTGKQPSDGQPLSYTKAPNFEDYGAGCVLLAAAETYKLSSTLENEQTTETPKTLYNIKITATSGNLKISNAGNCYLSLITPQGICLLNKQIIPDDNYTFMVSGLKPGMYLAIISGAKSIKVKVMIL